MKRNQFLAAVTGFAMVLLTSATVFGATYIQRSNGMVQYSSSSLRMLNNSVVKFVAAPKTDYRFAPNPSGPNTIKAVSGNQRWTLTTKYMLPRTHAARGNQNYDMTNPQSAALVGNYLYVVYQPHQFKNKGFIARYNLKMLRKMSFVQVQSALDAKQGNAAIKLGKFFTTGHGQSLAYNHKTRSLWMWRDTVMGITNRSTLQRLSAKSLTPNKAINFHMDSYGANISGGHDLTFDTAGNAYFWTIDRRTKGVKVYQGRIGNKSVKFRLTKQIFRHQPGTHQQAMGYNPKNGRLYLVADDSIASFPAKKLKGNGSLRNRDFKYSRFKSGREFESLVFDASGHGLLLSNKHPELLRSTTAY